MNYKHLSKDERIEIATLYNKGYSKTDIAKYLKRPYCTIYREIERNKIFDYSTNLQTYNYSKAHSNYKQKRIELNKKRIKILPQSLWSKHIQERLQENYSPEQISGKARLTQLEKGEKVDFPSFVTIYNYIYQNQNTNSNQNNNQNQSQNQNKDQNKDQNNNWVKYLKILGRKGKYRRKYGTKIREKEREKLNKRNISTRPEIVEKRLRVGDFEGDTIVGLEKNIHILTHVDRLSGFLIAKILLSATAEQTRDKTIESFQTIPKSKLKTITYDNGVQFSKHQDTEQKLNQLKKTKNTNIEIYFANPYHSWERGTNENTNGLLRYYYPKKTPFAGITQKELDKTVNRINNRPRKRLGYLTPTEVFIKNMKIKKLCTLG
jgi:transposase, IS30 family